jgi:anti-sigma factor RsiW
VTCREVVELMTDYLDNSLSPRDRARFEQHLSGCDGCTAYLAQLRAARTLMGRSAVEPVPELMRAELVKAFKTWKSG